MSSGVDVELHLLQNETLFLPFFFFKKKTQQQQQTRVFTTRNYKNFATVLQLGTRMMSFAPISQTKSPCLYTVFADTSDRFSLTPLIYR